MGREFLDPIALRRLVYNIKTEFSKYAKTTEIPSKLSELENDAGYITEVPEVVVPTKVSQLENDEGYSTEHYVDSKITTVQEKADSAYVGANAAYSMAEQAQNEASYAISQISQVENRLSEDITSVDMLKADKTTISTYDFSITIYEFGMTYNSEQRYGELTSLSFTFGNGEYPQDYISGLSFDSGATPTAIDYTDSGILNWVGTDCANSDGLSIFQPSPNTHYDIVFYFNGTQFIGHVNGFVPSTGNEAV